MVSVHNKNNNDLVVNRPLPVYARTLSHMPSVHFFPPGKKENVMFCEWDEFAMTASYSGLSRKKRKKKKLSGHVCSAPLFVQSAFFRPPTTGHSPKRLDKINWSSLGSHAGPTDVALTFMEAATPPVFQWVRAAQICRETTRSGGAKLLFQHICCTPLMAALFQLAHSL